MESRGSPSVCLLILAIFSPGQLEPLTLSAAKLQLSLLWVKQSLHPNTCFYHSYAFSSVQFSHSVMSYSLWPHGLQHARLPCPSPVPRTCSDSCPLSQWFHPTISARVQAQWIQGDSKVGTESASLEKYIFNYRYRERLETDNVVGKLEKKRLNNLVYVE